MLIDHSAGNYFHVKLADLVRQADRGLERSFATSEQLIEWVKKRPDTMYDVVLNGNRGEQLQPPANAFFGYSMENGDVFCGTTIIYDLTHGLREVKGGNIQVPLPTGGRIGVPH